MRIKEREEKEGIFDIVFSIDKIQLSKMFLLYLD